MDSAVSAARERLRDVTPLKRDCGKICGARCCGSLQGEETGMLLFPSEEEAYEGKAGWEIRETARGHLVLCPGSCDREDRPLACRLFPLLPRLEDGGGIRVVTDQRARAVCPLARQGRDAMDPDFIAAVREAGELLAAREEQAMFLELLEEEQEEIRSLRKRFRGE